MSPKRNTVANHSEGVGFFAKVIMISCLVASGYFVGRAENAEIISVSSAPVPADFVLPETILLSSEDEMFAVCALQLYTANPARLQDGVAAVPNYRTEVILYNFILGDRVTEGVYLCAE